MSVKGDTIFSNNPWDKGGENITYNQARQETDDTRKIILLKARMDVFLIDQIQEVSKHNSVYNPEIWSPFPLAVMTFLAIETLGRVISDHTKIKNKSNYETSKRFSRPIYQKIDYKLIDKPNKEFYLQMENRLGKNDKKSIDAYCDVIHKYMRNTYYHGFQGVLVYLNHNLETEWEINEGYLVINPYRFWDKFKSEYIKCFDLLIKNKDPKLTKNALDYFHKLLE